MKILKIFYAILQEITALLYHIIFYFFDQTKYDPDHLVQKGRYPILLVHGYLHNSSGWWLMRSRLKEAGYSNVYTVNLGHPWKSFEYYYHSLEKRIQELLKRTGSSKLILIGHSMGGLLSSYYASQHSGKVVGVITLGSPMEGSYVAKIAFSRSGREMIPGTLMMQKLESAITKTQNCTFYHLASVGDEIVIPNASAAPSYTPKSHIIWVGYLGHVAYLISGRIMQSVLHALSRLDTEQI